MINIREKVEKLLFDKSLSKSWLAQEINVAQGNLNRTLQNVNLQSAARIARVLNVDINSLIDNEENKNEEIYKGGIVAESDTTYTKNSSDMVQKIKMLESHVSLLMEKNELLEKENAYLKNEIEELQGKKSLA